MTLVDRIIGTETVPTRNSQVVEGHAGQGCLGWICLRLAELAIPVCDGILRGGNGRQIQILFKSILSNPCTLRERLEQCPCSLEDVVSNCYNIISNSKHTNLRRRQGCIVCTDMSGAIVWRRERRRDLGSQRCRGRFIRLLPFFTAETKCLFDPLVRPVVLVKVLRLEGRMQDLQDIEVLDVHSILPVQIDTEVKEVQKDELPPIEDLWNNIYVDGLGAKLQPIEKSLPKIQL